MTENQALRLALEALTYSGLKPEGTCDVDKAAITAIKEALAQPPRQPLTPGTIRNMYARHCDPVELVRAVEKLHGVGA